MKENLRRTKDDPTNQYYAYVTRDDLVEVYPEESVILTMRNYDNYETTPKIICEDDSGDEMEDEITDPGTLRVHGRYKTIDVRLVTNEGEALHQNRTAIKKGQEEGHNKKEDNIPPYLSSTSSSQPTKPTESNKKRAGRSRRSVKNDETVRDGVTKGEEDEEEELKVTAKTLLGYGPPKKQLKRNLDEVSDSFESR